MTGKRNLLKQLQQLHTAMLEAEQAHQELIAKVLPSYYNSAVNLIDYLSLRTQNIEALQKQLHNTGLSSLSNSESHIKQQLIHVMNWLGNVTREDNHLSAEDGQKQLQHNVVQLLGRAGSNNVPPVMVTFDTLFAEDIELLCDLLNNGMRIARINCAHDDQETWLKMADSLKKAMHQTNLPCKLYMDLAGPKIRTRIMGKKNKHGKLKVAVGDKVILADSSEEGEVEHKFIACTLQGLVEKLKPKHRVYFDDGLFEAEVQTVDGKQATLEITRISAKKPVIKSEKGINLPDTDFQINPITDFDQQCLSFIIAHADMLGFSFVNTAADMEELQMQLKRLNKPDFPVIAKIETSKAVSHLPAIILQGMQQGPVGVMVARGDMAMEVGFERMSEVQDELLWICEAAHTPVIWATQVLETMHKQGLATRSEITDAAHAAAADCVMLNKGDHTLKVLQSLNDILTRSRRNIYKNRRLFRQLSIAQNFIRGKFLPEL